MSRSRLAVHSRDLSKYHIGDNLAINSDTDKIIIYLEGKLAAKSAISQALSGRIF